MLSIRLWVVVFRVRVYGSCLRRSTRLRASPTPLIFLLLAILSDNNNNNNNLAPGYEQRPALARRTRDRGYWAGSSYGGVYRGAGEAV